MAKAEMEMEINYSVRNTGPLWTLEDIAKHLQDDIHDMSTGGEFCEYHLRYYEKLVWILQKIADGTPCVVIHDPE